MVWIKSGGKWVQKTKTSIGMVSPSDLKRRREAFERKKQTASFKAWRRKKMLLQKGLCYLCHAPMKGMTSVDHIKPLALGGTSTYSNLALCHLSCNRRKGIQSSRNTP